MPGMIEDNARPRSRVGADKNYDNADFVASCRERGCTPHCLAQNVILIAARHRWPHHSTSRLSH
jgi:hypothetical protein